MKSIVICEKPKQAQDIRKAVGDAFGEVLPAQGHLVELAQPEDVNADWKTWSCAVLAPKGLYPTRPSQGRDAKDRQRLKSLLGAIEKGLKKAETVVIATDCDREGQLIGEELIRHFGYAGRVMRAMFTAQDPASLRKAFGNLVPNETYHGLGQAGVARQQSDQIANLSLTRGATVCLRPAGERGVIGVGRVKTPTLAIVCLRELEIENFKPVTYYEIAAQATPGGDAARRFEMRHAPGDSDRILDAAAAERIRSLAEGFAGPLAVSKQNKRSQPPSLTDLPALQKRASQWGWTAERTLEVAQSLYDTHQVITYPRAEVRHVPESFAGDVVAILAGLKALPPFQGLAFPSPIVRKGKSGHFCDKCIEGEGHHAVIPNVNTAGGFAQVFGRMNADERRLFDFIARRYMAALWPDNEYEATVASLDVQGHAFVARGRITTVPGWREVYGGDDNESDAMLPPLASGEPASLGDVAVDGKQTKAPNRYTEGSLIDAMSNAWRYVEDKDKQERLKEAKGIGTTATRGAVIEGLKRQGQLQAMGKNIVPTEAGMSLFKALRQVSPRMVDPGLTAEMEFRLDAVVRGDLTAEAMIAEVAEETAVCMSALEAARGRVSVSTGRQAGAGRKGGGNGRRTGARPGGKTGAPTPKQLKAVEVVARKAGVTPPADYKTSAASCSAFLDRHGSSRAA